MNKFLERDHDGIVKYHLLRYLNFDDRQSLRQTCHDGKNAVPHVPMSRPLGYPQRFHDMSNNDSAKYRYDPITQHVYGAPDELSSELHDVKKFIRIVGAFAALRYDGRLITWGDLDSSNVQDALFNLKDIFSNLYAFAALKHDGRVITCGDAEWGGNSSSVQHELIHIKKIVPTMLAFAALRDDGRVITWGDAERGGDSSSVQHELFNVENILSNGATFLAIRDDRRMIEWGCERNVNYLRQDLRELVNVKQVVPGIHCFAALRQDGSVISWGNKYSGGSDSSSVQSLLHNIEKIEYSFYPPQQYRAFREDGTVIT